MIFRMVYEMKNVVLYTSSCLSCFIIMTILLEFMNERYQKSYKNKYLYIVARLGITAIIAAVNMINSAFFNFIIWIVAVAVCAYCLYYENANKPLKRILECEVLACIIAVCETLGVVITDQIVLILRIKITSDIMMYSLEMAFSKVILIFLYYMVVAGLMRKREMPVSRLQYLSNFVILAYTLVDLVVIVYNMNNQQENYFLLINFGCIVLADLYLVYLVKVMNEKAYLEYEIRLLERQSKLQYQYYVRQEQKYNRTVGILHDVNKHMKLVKQLCINGETENAGEYAAQTSDMLQPLIPMKYTGNPILDILLTDRTEIMVEKGIYFDIKVDKLSLDFIDSIDVTTIFGNLLDNAIEACGRVEMDKSIYILIKPYHEMVAIQIKNSCSEIRWKKGWPVSEKKEHRGIGLLNVKQTIEKYDGSMSLKEQDGMFIVDIFLNA